MVFKEHNSLTDIKQSIIRRFALASAALATVAVMGVSGVAGAAPPGKPNKADCQTAGFKNYGQCVKEWAHSKNHGGGGYGGGDQASTVNTGVNTSLNHSNHNVIQTIINFFFGG